VKDPDRGASNANQTPTKSPPDSSGGLNSYIVTGASAGGVVGSGAGVAGVGVGSSDIRIPFAASPYPRHASYYIVSGFCWIINQ